MSPRNLTKNRPAASLLALALALGALIGIASIKPALAEDASPQRTMTVTGTGNITARPDIAYLQSGVVSEGKTAKDALSGNTKAMNDIFDGLAKLNIDKDDIRTSQFSVSPLYTQPPVRPDGTREPRTIRGYQVTNQVTVTVRKLDRLGDILDKLVSLGSNQLNGVRFEIENPEPLLDQAREAAVLDALRKAKLYANASGVALGPVLKISENGGYQQPVYMKAAMAMREDSSVPVAAGTQNLSASVTLTIGIE